MPHSYSHYCNILCALMLTQFSLSVASTGAPQVESEPVLLVAPFDSSKAQAAQAALAKQLNVDTKVTNKSGIELILIPPGEYLRGSSEADVAYVLRADSEHVLKALHFVSEQPQHRVRITKPFHMASTETTQDQFQKVLGRNTAWFSKAGFGADEIKGQNTSQFPMERVTWFDAIEFCNKLSENEKYSPCYELQNIERDKDLSIKNASVRIVNGKGYRLPTEAEWEYACRAGTSTAFHCGDALAGNQANVDFGFPFGTATKSLTLNRTSKVASYPANNFGIYDMSGNVNEWCHDAHDDSAYREFEKSVATDPVVTKPTENRVVRGGSWKYYGRGARSSHRGANSPESRDSSYGFRVVRICESKT